MIPGIRKDAAVAFCEIFDEKKVKKTALDFIQDFTSSGDKLKFNKEPENQKMFSCCSFQSTCSLKHGDGLNPWIKIEAAISLISLKKIIFQDEDNFTRIFAEILEIESKGSKMVDNLQNKIREFF